MAKLKKLNPETGQYEEVINLSILSLKDSSEMQDSHKTVYLEDVVTPTVSGNFTTFILSGVKKGDVIVTANGQTTGTFKHGTEDITSLAVKEFQDNYSWATYTLTAKQDYDTLTVSANNNWYLKERCTWTYIPSELRFLPSFNNEFVPTLNDEESSDIKTLSSRKIYDLFGKSETRAKEKLQGGVWIALGDSYTEYAKTNFSELATKYGMIYDGQARVSSTICGDVSGNKGFVPFWNRMDTFIANYTGDGQTINDVAYTADDVKLITFMGGANDGFGKDSWLGSHTSMDGNYIYGACNYIFRKLKETFSNAKIICILQPANYSDAMNYTDDETAQILGFKDLAELQTWDIYSFGQYKMETKERAVKECAERFGIHIVDCIFDWYSVVNPTERATYWSTDKIHLSSQGTAELTKKLEQDGILVLFGK